jgi:hypothetical protein
VSIVCFVGFIGALCYIWRKKKWAKSRGLGDVKPVDLDTTYAGAEIKYRRVSELEDTSRAPAYTDAFEVPPPEAATLLPVPEDGTLGSPRGNHSQLTLEEILRIDKRSYYGRLAIDEG